MAATPTKTIYLDQHDWVFVTDECYQAIQKLLEGGMVCRFCGHTYRENENPQVQRNTCVVCFLDQKRKANMPLSYLRTLTKQGFGDSVYISHEFLSASDGYIYTSSCSSHELSKDIVRSLGHHGFILPKESFERSGWTVYGSIARDLAVVGHHTPRSSSNDKAATFLLYKDDVPRELSKRRRDDRALFAEAYKRLEVTKDGNGYYHPYLDEPENTSSRLYDSHAWSTIARMEHDRLHKT